MDSQFKWFSDGRHSTVSRKEQYVPESFRREINSDLSLNSDFVAINLIRHTQPLNHPLKKILRQFVLNSLVQHRPRFKKRLFLCISEFRTIPKRFHRTKLFPNPTAGKNWPCKAELCASQPFWMEWIMGPELGTAEWGDFSRIKMATCKGFWLLITVALCVVNSSGKWRLCKEIPKKTYNLEIHPTWKSSSPADSHLTRWNLTFI